jgi:nucleotide-binding universal stress UspA family protein
MVAIDGSESSRYALRHLTDCPLPKDATVQVIHVLPPKLTADAFAQSWLLNMEMTAPVVTPEMQRQFEQKMEEEQKLGEQLLAETVDSLKEQGITAEGVLRRGDAADEILNHARETETDLIVVGSRGLGALRSLFLGSVSRKLVHYADRSVLVVRKPTTRSSP